MISSAGFAAGSTSSSWEIWVFAGTARRARRRSIQAHHTSQLRDLLQQKNLNVNATLHLWYFSICCQHQDCFMCANKRATVQNPNYKVSLQNQHETTRERFKSLQNIINRICLEQRLANFQRRQSFACTSPWFSDLSPRRLKISQRFNCFLLVILSPFVLVAEGLEI